MADTTDRDRIARQWADHQLSLEVNDEGIVIAARAIKAHVPAAVVTPRRAGPRRTQSTGGSMTIAPEQADRWAQDATDGPWYVHTDPDDPDGTFIYDEMGNMCIAVDQVGSAYLEADLTLAAAAPDLAQTIAGMRWEYAVEMMEEEWEMVGIYGPDEPWGSENDARYAMEAWRSSNPIRLVRRPVGPVEVVE